MAKRIKIERNGGPGVLEVVEFIPPPPAADEVQVANKAIGINYIDTYIRSGLYPSELPTGLGTEAAGVVTDTGSGVSKLKPGDRVVYAQAPSGAYSSIHNVPASKVVRLPDMISYEQGAACFLKGLTVWYLIQQTYSVRPSETFLFHAAAGGVGLIACQWARALGAHLIGTVGSPEKALLAKKAGAWATINYLEESVPQRVLELTQGKKVPVVYDSVGKSTWEASLDCLQRRGLLVSFGNSSGPVTGVDLAVLNQKGSLYVTRPSLFGYITNHSELTSASNELFSLMASGAIYANVPENQKFALDEVQRAHVMLESRVTQGSCLLIP